MLPHTKLEDFTPEVRGKGEEREEGKRREREGKEKGKRREREGKGDSGTNIKTQQIILLS